MTAEVKEPETFPRYCPEAYASHLIRITRWPWPEGTTPAQSRAAEHDLMRVLIEVADAYVGGDTLDVGRLVAQKLPDIPVELSPLRYFRAVARQMATPLWEQYTAEQRKRGYEYAALYVRGRMAAWLQPRHRHSAEEIEEIEEPEFTWSDMPREARVQYTEQFAAKTTYRRWLTMVQAYLATHPGDEVVPAELRTVMGRWVEPDQVQAFF